MSPPSSAVPFIFSGGYPIFAIYEIRAPNEVRASTRILIGRSCMRSVPVIIHSPGVIANNAVRKRIDVPAAFTSIRLLPERKASIITCVSSQSERFSRVEAFKLRPFRIRALLLILLDAGSAIVEFMAFGATILYCMI